jgi:UDP:flavonoid glycosyltransferase YjiC (YdhE family)
MARIAFAWEWGAELGHAMACATLGRALGARGHDCVFALRELRQLDKLPLEGRTVYQAPFHPRQGEGFGTPSAWPDLLLGCGYADVEELRGLVAGWIEVLRASRADLVVADSAPTALLAARILRIRRADYGNGFSIPPRASPVPPFRVDARIDRAELERREARVLANVNAVLAQWASPPLRALHEQLDVDASFLCTLPELDQYGARSRAEYWGPRFTVDAGEDVPWPYGEGARVLVYLQARDPRIDAVVEGLARHRCRVVAYLSGPDARDARARLRSAQRRVIEHPVRLAGLLPDCDLCVSHGGDIAGAALMQGVPQLVLPLQYEQVLTGVRLEQLAAGIAAPRMDAPAEAGAALDRVLRERSRLEQGARACARRYPAFSPAEQQRRIVARIEQVVAREARA